MAASIARAGFPLTAWTHTPGKAERWAGEHGASAGASPADVAGASDIVVSMLVDGDQVAATLLGEDGVIAAGRAGLLCVDCSTIGPPQTRRIGAALRERRIAMLDAPVSGSAPRAEDGSLTIMAGGAPGDFARALPVLEAMGALVVHVGELGQGEMLKLINNALGAANAAAVAEALLLGAATSLDLDQLVEVVSSGSGASAQLELKSGPMRAHNFEALFKTEHMLKDVRLCLDQAQAAGVPFPSAAHARDLLTAAVGRGLGERDYAAMIEPAEGFAGRRL